MSNLKEDSLTQAHRTKVKYFFDNKSPVHVKFKLNYFKNGNITVVSKDFFVLEDFKEGEMVISFFEIERVDKYKTGENWHDKKF